VSDEPGSKVFDMPHARVTLTPMGPGIEIEVWPKAGQSAYAVVDPTVAVLIARHLVELAAAQLTALQLMDDPDDGDEDEDATEPAALTGAAGSTDDDEEEDEEEATADNVVDLFSRRRPVR
jgi:hypothetical protein